MSQALTVDAETEALIEAEVGIGRFGDAAEMVKVAIRALVDDLELAGFRQSLDHARVSGAAGSGDEVLDEIEADIRAGL